MTTGAALFDLLRGVDDPRDIQRLLDQLTVEQRKELIQAVCDRVASAAQALVRDSEDVWQTKQMPEEVCQLVTPHFSTEVQ